MGKGSRKLKRNYKWGTHSSVGEQKKRPRSNAYSEFVARAAPQQNNKRNIQSFEEHKERIACLDEDIITKHLVQAKSVREWERQVG